MSKPSHATRRHAPASSKPSKRSPTTPARRSRGATVHFTDHTCRAYDATLVAPPGRTLVKPGFKSFKHYDSYMKCERWTGGKDDRIIAWGACRIVSEKWRAPAVNPARHRFTTDRSQVTCERCIAVITKRAADDSARPADHMIASDALRQIDAWELCCKDRGCERPVVAGGAEAMAAAERQLHARTVDSIIAEARAMVAAAILGPADDFEAWLGKVQQQVPAHVFDTLRPLLHATEIALQGAVHAALALSSGVKATREARTAAFGFDISAKPANDGFDSKMLGLTLDFLGTFRAA